MKTDNKIQVDFKIGDVMYIEARLSNIKTATIERFTNTQVVMSDGNKLKKPIGDYNTPIGVSGWNVSTYKPETPELKEKYERQELMVFISRFSQDSRLKSLTTDQLTQIKKIMQSV